MHVVIPARFAATRLPGKPLRDVGGAPLVVRVYERALASGADRVTVATDDRRVALAVQRAGGEVVMTAATHASGTDRIAEALRVLGVKDDEVIVNLQGDEPLMPPGLLRQIAERLAREPGLAMATAAHALSGDEEFHSPHVVKVVCDQNGRALYFSRAPIPWPRLTPLPGGPLRHIGLYAYRAGFVQTFTAWGPCPLEQCEGLEQLRALEHGAAIGVVVTDCAIGPGVDTEADLHRVNALWTPS